MDVVRGAGAVHIALLSATGVPVPAVTAAPLVTAATQRLPVHRVGMACTRMHGTGAYVSSSWTPTASN